MCMLINSRVVLYNLFEVEAIKKLDSESFAKFREEVVKRFGDAYVEISDSSIRAAVEADKELFSFSPEGDNVVCRGPLFTAFIGDREFLNGTVNKDFTDEIKDVLREAANALVDFLKSRGQETVKE